jgi:polyphosphate glucokinase
MGLISYLNDPKPQDVDAEEPGRPQRILVIDIGGTHVKLMQPGESSPQRADSGKEFTPDKLVKIVKSLQPKEPFEAISIGYPGVVGPSGPRAEAANLGSGWVGFDFASALGCPVRIINDAVMQAMGSYDGGRMLFIGLGTGVGSTLIVDNVIITLELGRLSHPDGKTVGETLGRAGMRKLGTKKWRRAVKAALRMILPSMVVDYVVVGGGNAKEMKGDLPHNVWLGHNLTAFRGGLRLWKLETVPTHDLDEETPALSPTEWRLF